MAARHHKTMEAGGWVLLAAAIAWLLYLLFHKTGQAMLSGGTAVSSTVGGVSTGPPSIKLDDPTKPATYTAPDGSIYLWDVAGQQWHLSSMSSGPPNPAAFNLPPGTVLKQEFLV